MRQANGYGSITKLKGKRRRPWMVRVTTGWEFDEQGMKVKQTQKPLGYYATRQEAIKALADFNNDPFIYDGLTITFGEIWEHVLKTDIPEASARNYIAAYKYLEPITNMPIKDIKADHMQKCIDACQNSQQNMIKICCHKIYKYALKKELTVKNPSKFLTVQPYETQMEREIFTHDEIETLWNTHEWWAKVTLMLLYTGMRTKELREIELEMVDFDNAWLDLEFGKNKYSVRGIPIHEKVLPLFRDYLINGGNLYGFAHSTLNKYLNKLNGHRAHDCRHTFTTRMREVKVDHVTIQRLLGHKPDDITYQVYTHISREELSDAICKLIY